jgi:hypothetical protein
VYKRQEYYTRKVTINLDPTEPKLEMRVILSWMKSILSTTINPFKIIYWLNYNFKILKTNKKAYQIWEENGCAKIKEFLLKNVPMSVHGK